jgi:large subunit ribosomal protein L15
MPLIRRLPKRGFRSPFKEVYEIVNVESLNRFAAGKVVDPAALSGEGLIRGNGQKVKVLGTGDLRHSLTVQAHRFSQSAQEKIQAAGGKVEVIA